MRRLVVGLCLLGVMSTVGCAVPFGPRTESNRIVSPMQDPRFQPDTPEATRDEHTAAKYGGVALAVVGVLALAAVVGVASNISHSIH